MIPRFLVEEKEGDGTFSKCLCCYDYGFYDPAVLLQRCDAELRYFFFFLLRTITRLNTGCVTGQHTALVAFPPTQVELNTVDVIMLLFYEQFSRSALVSRTCVPSESSAFTREIRQRKTQHIFTGRLRLSGREMKCLVSTHRGAARGVCLGTAPVDRHLHQQGASAAV